MGTLIRWELEDGGTVVYDEHFVPANTAREWFLRLRDTVKWEQKKGAFGKWQPRLTASFGDPGTTYAYSGTRNPAVAWTEDLLEIRDRVETVAGRFNFCLLNRYRTGADSVGWHADDERGLGPTIASVSLGATRLFRLRHRASRQIHSLRLAPGSLLIMGGTLQQFWEHEIPKTTEDVGERINLTFRWVDADGTG